MIENGVDSDTGMDCKMERCARGVVRVGVTMQAVLPVECAAS
jgi:hypothetical protein